jgi:galactonate dehydratase
VLSQTLPFEGSTAQLPIAPGLGIDVDEKEAAKYPFQQEPLMRYFHDDGSVADW